jgi:hypothetical protein
MSVHHHRRWDMLLEEGHVPPDGSCSTPEAATYKQQTQHEPELCKDQSNREKVYDLYVWPQIVGRMDVASNRPNHP